MNHVMKFALASAAILGAAPAMAIGFEGPRSNGPLGFEAANQPGRTISPPAVKSASGSRDGFSWTARSTVVGQTPTSDVLPPSNTIGGGDPIYFPSANKRGTVAIIMEREQGFFICSGSVIGNGMSIATAAHCVSDGFGTANPISTTVHFFNGDPDARFTAFPVVRSVSSYFVNEGYTGEVIDQNDIAILRLNAAAPGFAQRYELFTDPIANGTQFNVAGYGARSTVGGNAGTSSTAVAGRTGFLREGDNIYDYAWGDAAFGGFFTDIIGGETFFGTAAIEFSIVSDFDNGLAANDAAGLIGQALGAGSAFNDTGLGAREVGIAGGDSGGPGFIDGKLATINSYGLSFGPNFGDILGAVPPQTSGLNNSFGEFSGYVPVWIHTDFIESAIAAPEPESWAMLITGFGLIGASMRRRRRIEAAA